MNEEKIVFKLDGMTPYDVAVRIADAVSKFNPYVCIEVNEEEVAIYKERFRISSDD